MASYLSPNNTTDFRFIVFEGDSGAGPFTNIGESVVSGVGPGAGWYESGDLDVPLQAGKWYYLATYWNLLDIVFTDSYASLPQNLSFGTAQYGAADWGRGYPPPNSLTPGLIDPYFDWYARYDTFTPAWVTIGTDYDGPDPITHFWEALWDTTMVPNGSYLVRAMADDGWGNYGTDINEAIVDNSVPPSSPGEQENNSGVTWVVAPPPQMKAGQAYKVSWKVQGVGPVESTYVAFSQSPQVDLTLPTTPPQNGKPGVYEGTLFGSWSGRYYFTPVAKLGGKVLSGPTVAANVGF
jgi:hypothetical protein